MALAKWLGIAYKNKCLAFTFYESNMLLAKRLFYITANYGTDANMRRSRPLKKVSCIPANECLKCAE